MNEQTITPLTPLISPIFETHNITVYMKREELNHPYIQGNKWHKLKFNIQEALIQHKTTLLTFGGAYSNHIAATAVAAQEAGLTSIGIIRGEELSKKPEKWSHTLKEAAKNGMVFLFISRSEYRNKSTNNALKQLETRFPDAYIIPEGGSNSLAVKGFQPLMQQIEEQCPDWTHLFSAVGTGATLAGIVKYASVKSKHLNHPRIILGVPVLKQGDYLRPQIKEWIAEPHVNSWQLLTDYHCGGYAKTPDDLLQQKATFEQAFGIPLDPIYTAKMMYAFYDQLKQNKIKPGSKVILLHTGGLQGNL
ncbi:pyridoxal phosphate-dependent deaminase, putative [hydrothermal vent metagenome]|uniref:Pyridoxal phosphate-dependent deaminase, putative n=1 Tax=hydrothermal vent metagenome TaxID=652676 RepID=A0A3B0X264_9ZZZZ